MKADVQLVFAILSARLSHAELIVVLASSRSTGRRLLLEEKCCGKLMDFARVVFARSTHFAVASALVVRGIGTDDDETLGLAVWQCFRPHHLEFDHVGGDDSSQLEMLKRAVRSVSRCDTRCLSVIDSIQDECRATIALLMTDEPHMFVRRLGAGVRALRALSRLLRIHLGGSAPNWTRRRKSSLSLSAPANSRFFDLSQCERCGDSAWVCGTITASAGVGTRLGRPVRICAACAADVRASAVRATAAARERLFG